MSTRRDAKPERINYWILFNVCAGCAAAISIALFLSVVYRNERIDDANEAKEEMQRGRLNAAPEPMIFAYPKSAAEIEDVRRRTVARNPLVDLPKDTRCINGQAFHVAPHEYDQLPDTSSAKFCR
jgi:hypothetical protein